jgi:Gpi18-like mannosyltransferase
LGREWVVLGAIVLGGLCIRLPLLTHHGYSGDVMLFARWAALVNEGGLTAAYAEHANYPPLYLYVLGALGHVGTALGIGGDFISGALPVPLLKTPGLLADLLLGLAVYWSARPWSGANGALMAAAAVELNPALIYDTAYWGQVDSIHTLFMVVALGAALSPRRGLGPGLAGGFWALAFATKAQSLVAVPSLLVVAAKQGRRALAEMLLGAMAFGALALLPAAWERALPQVADVYLGVADAAHYFTMNAFNLWEIFLQSPVRGPGVTGTDDRELFLGPLSYLVTGLGLLTAWVALHMVILWKRDARSWLPWVSVAAVALGFFFLPTQIHERYLYPAVVFLALAITRDRWLAAAWAILSTTFFLNLAFVFPPPDPWGAPFRNVGEPTKLVVSLANGVVILGLVTWLARRRGDVEHQDDLEIAHPPSPTRIWGVAALGATVVLGTAFFLSGGMAHDPSPYVTRTLDSRAVPIDARLSAGVRVAGFRMAPECPAPGNIVHLSLYWEATEGHRPAAHTRVMLIRDQGTQTRLSQRDPGSGIYPTQAWEPGQLVRDDHDFWVADNLSAGSYELRAGVVAKQPDSPNPVADAPILHVRWERGPGGQIIATCSPVARSSG